MRFTVEVPDQIIKKMQEEYDKAGVTIPVEEIIVDTWLLNDLATRFIPHMDKKEINEETINLLRRVKDGHARVIKEYERNLK